MEALRSSVLKISRERPSPHENFGKTGEGRGAESEFLQAFGKAYLEGVRSDGVAAEEFALPGYGIADLVWISWSRSTLEDGFTAISLEKNLHRRQLFAFEGKIKDWRRALQQAFRYRYFADKSVVVMPHAESRPALAHLEAFEHAFVGFWSFDCDTGTIRKHFTPTRVRAFSREARSKAIRILTSKLDLSHFCE